MATKASLEEQADRLNRVLSLEGADRLTVEYAYGRPRLFRGDGSREVSPRLSKPMLELFMDGMMAGIEMRGLTDRLNRP